MPPKKRKKRIGRANGTGTVYKLQGNRRKPWVAKVSDGRELHEDKAVLKRQIIGYFESEEEAIKALDGHLVNPVAPRNNITLGELYEEWSDVHYPKVSETSVKNYKTAWTWMEHLKNVKYSEMRKGQYEKMIVDMLREGKSEASMRLLLLVAKMISQYALENDIAQKNYAANIKLPRMAKNKKQAFSEIEIAQIKKRSNDVQNSDLVMILLYTGLRIGEALKLTKFDIKNGIITAGSKTEAGTDRQIPVHSLIEPMIRKRAEKADPYIFPMSQHTFRKYYYQALEDIGVRRLTPHECRHTCATMMANAGINTIYIQKFMGHTNYALTANVYTHIDPEEMKKQMNAL